MQCCSRKMVVLASALGRQSKRFYISWSSYKYLMKVDEPVVKNMLLSKVYQKPYNTMVCRFMSGSIPSPDTEEEPYVQYTTQEDISNIAGGDEDLEKKLKVLILEHEVLKQDGVRVPAMVRPGQWKELLGMETRSKRRKYYKFLWLNEKRRENDKRKKEEKQKVLGETKTETISEDHIIYGLCRNTIFLRLYDKTINSFYNNNLVKAMLFNQPIVIDCSYDSHMTAHESQNCALQLMLLFSENRMHNEPYNLYLCNAERNSSLIRRFEKFVPPLYDDSFPINVTEKSYLDVFPKEKIVYLTPHCREELLTYDHDAVYVIGAMVDKSNNEPLSLARAKKEGLKVAKLPIDRHLEWGPGGGKSLTINQMIQIMLEIRSSGDWMKALKFVPKRKLRRDDEIVSRTSQQAKFRRKRSSLVY